MRAFLIDVQNACAKEIDVQDKLEEYYKLIGCDYIDIVTRTIDGVEFDIICDDEGLFVENPRLSVASNSGTSQVLVGNVILLHHNDAGEMTELSREDIPLIRRHVKVAFSTKCAEHPLLEVD